MTKPAQTPEGDEQNKAPEKLLTIKETYELLRVSKWTLYELLRKRQLDSIQIGRRRLIPMSSVTKFIEKLKTDYYEAY